MTCLLLSVNNYEQACAEVTNVGTDLTNFMTDSALDSWSLHSGSTSRMSAQTLVAVPTKARHWTVHSASSVQLKYLQPVFLR
jgi:hypothetical protein